MRERKMRHKTSEVENAREENEAQDCRGEKCGKNDVSLCHYVKAAQSRPIKRETYKIE